MRRPHVPTLAACLAGAIASAGLAGSAAAHPMAPALLELESRGEGRFALSFQSGLRRAAGTDPAPILPPHCEDVGASSLDVDGVRLRMRREIDCGERGLVGHELTVRDLAEARISALVRIRLEDGRLVSAVLDARRPRLRVPVRPRRLAVAGEYARMGFIHIWEGLDHLLFVFGLFWLAAGARALIGTLTAFTVGHSVTLSLAALDLVRVPSGPVEVLIAASVLVVALSLAREVRGLGALRHRMTWAIAGSFGLLHGLGFAGALAEAGLPQGEIPTALLAFNVGIELGQLAFVGVLIPLRHGARRLAGAVAGPWPRRGEIVAVYAMGGLSAYWCLDRLLAWLREGLTALGV